MPTTQEKLKKINQFKQNPGFASLLEMQQIKRQLRDELKDEIKNIAQEIVKDITETRDQTKERIIRETRDEVERMMKNKDFDVIQTIVNKTVSQTLANIKGDRGDKGEKGEKGDVGEPGQTPDKQEIVQSVLLKIPPPIPGKNGKNANPKDVLKLIKLPKSETGEQIAEKLNTTKSSIKLAAIQGLEEELKSLSSRISNARQKSGGGMGNVQHETFSISSGTTTVQTNHTIAGNGTAIVNFAYQNANLELTNHYTVGSDKRTITFDSDVQSQLQDNTIASITYIRG